MAAILLYFCSRAISEPLLWNLDFPRIRPLTGSVHCASLLFLCVFHISSLWTRSKAAESESEMTVAGSRIIQSSRSRNRSAVINSSLRWCSLAHYHVEKFKLHSLVRNRLLGRFDLVAGGGGISVWLHPVPFVREIINLQRFGRLSFRAFKCIIFARFSSFRGFSVRLCGCHFGIGTARDCGEARLFDNNLPIASDIPSASVCFKCVASH